MAREAAAQEASTYHFPGIFLSSLGMRIQTDVLRKDTCSLDDLLTTYSIEGCFVHPADPFDLERLLESGYCGDPNGNESSR